MKKVISPPTGRYVFDGGLNSKFGKSLIGDNESPDCLNVKFKNMIVETRDGFSKLNTTAIGSFAVDGLYTRHTNTGGETMVVFAGGSAWTLAGTTFATVGSAQSVFTAGVRVSTAEYQQHMFIGNGGVIPYKYNGTDFTRHGVYPPVSTHSVATGAAGNPSGDYRHKITYVNSQGVESDVGPVNTTIAVSSEKIELSAIPVGPQSWGVDARKIYRTVTSGATFFLVATLNDNTTTTYSDNIADASLGAEAPSDKGVPPKYGVVIYHRDRLFCNDPDNPNFVYYSDLQEPYTFGALNFFRFGDNTADLVRCLAKFDEHLAVFGDKGIQIQYMPSTDDTAWLPVRVNSPYGCISPFGIVPYKDGLLFPAVQEGKFVGFAHLTGTALAPSVTFLTVAAAGSDLLSDKIQPDIDNVNATRIDEITAFNFKKTSFFALSYGSGSTENDRIYIFDFNISNLSKKTPYSWAPWDGLHAAQFTEYGGDLYFGDSRAVGFIRKQTEGTYNDDSAAIDSYYWTKEFGGNKGEFNFHKDFRFGNLLVDAAGAYQMNLTVRTDSSSAAGNTQVVDLDPGGSLWGTMEWGTDPWGGGVTQKEVSVDLGVEAGKRIQFKFDNQNTADQKFGVHSLNFLYNTKGFR